MHYWALVYRNVMYFKNYSTKEMDGSSYIGVKEMKPESNSNPQEQNKRPRNGK